ncbi:Deoxyribodipyrimidine photo-lyase [bacterium HR29]|nr:Deoxyribodipyrimidine photo-lyase [bacterium HR29]
MSSSLVWFRRDLRVHDHPALWQAMSEGTAFALFVLDSHLLGAPTTGPRRVRFLLESLRQLRERLGQLGVPLLVREGPPEHWVPEVARTLGVVAVHVTADFTPYSRRRDGRVARNLESAGVRFVRHHGALLAPWAWPKVAEAARLPSFTSFYRAVRSATVGHPLGPPPPQRTPGVPADPVPSPASFGADIRLPAGIEPGEMAARARLDRFASERLARYVEARNSLDVDATSGLSQDLHFGLLSPREVAVRCPSAPFVRQLWWREYAHFVLWHRPDLTTRPYRLEFERLPWRQDRASFERWRKGETGFPMVDAAMRELAATGRMPNRLRMLTASFLTKDLLVDWRWGMAHFLHELVDGDVANNTFGWQWAASLGVDAASPFRAFSPARHLERFDPHRDYVRRWLPELCDGSDAYPSPIVDHQEAARRARELWRAAAVGENAC